MPDVGVLNLQIHDNSSTAADGLDKLAAKLEAIKQATTGSKLSTIANGIKRINTELKGMQPSALHKLKQLADVLERIGNVSGNVGGIRISFGGRGQSAEDISAQMQAARDAVAQSTAEFEQIGQRIAEDTQGANAFAGAMDKVNAIVQNVGWTAQATAEQFSQMFQVMNSARMSGALGSGAGPFMLGDGSGGSGADWTYWKDGAIEVEGTVTEAMDAISLGAGEAVLRLTGVVGATSEITSSIQEMADGGESFGNTASEFENVAKSVQQATDAMQAYNEAIEFAKKWNASGPAANVYKGQEAADIEYVNNLIQSATQADLLIMRIDALRDKLYQMAGSGKYTGDQLARIVGQIQNLQAKLDGLSATADNVKKSFSEIMIGTNGMKGAFSRMFPTLTSLAKRFSNLMKYRALRAVIRQIAEAFKVGIENYYHYSSAIGGEFAEKMDNASSSLLQMKNSIGAATAPLISSLIPLLQTVVSWFIEGVNYANQFMALLRGQQTWSRATQQNVKAFDDTKKSAKAAGSAIKDLLADWDELNIIQSENGGSGSGAETDAMSDYLNMFEEVSEYEEWVKSLGDIFKNTFGDALTTAGLIGTAILGWKVSKAFNGVLGKLGKIATGIVLEIIGVETAYNSGADAGMNGWNTGNTLGAIGGTLATALGGSLITSTMGLGGGVGFAIGIGVGIVATLYGYIKGRQKAADAVKWGNLHLTADEVKEYVRSQFAFDVTAEINALHTSITDMQGAKDEADQKILEFEQTLNEAKVNISMGVNKDPNGNTVKAALASAQAAVTSLQGLITSTNTGIEIGLKYLPMTDGEGNDISDQFLESVEVAETPLREYLFGLGKDMAKAMYEGESAGWDEGTTKAALDLMEKQKRIVERAKELENDRKFNTAVNDTFSGVVKDGIFDRETAEAAFAEQKKQIDEWTEAARTQAREYAANLEYLADLAQSASEEEARSGNFDAAKELADSAEALRNKAKERLSQVETDIETKLKETRSNIENQWIELISTVYGEDVGKLIREKIAHTQYGDGGYYFGYVMDELTGLGHYTEYGEALKQGGTAKEIADRIKKVLKPVYSDLGGIIGLEYQGPTIIDQILEEFVGNPLQIADKDAKEALRKSLIDYFGNEEFGNDVFNHLFDIHAEVPVDVTPVPEIVETEPKGTFDIEYESETTEMNVPVEFSADASGIKEAIEEAMTDGIMETSEAMDIMVKFGINEYDAALKELQYNLDEEGRNLGKLRPIGMIASAGVSDVGGGRSGLYNPTPFQTEQDNQQQVSNTASGVEKGVGNLYDALQSILRVAEAINRKEFKVVITPSSTWGRNNQQSAEQFDRITG